MSCLYILSLMPVSLSSFSCLDCSSVFSSTALLSISCKDVVWSLLQVLHRCFPLHCLDVWSFLKHLQHTFFDLGNVFHSGVALLRTSFQSPRVCLSHSSGNCMSLVVLCDQCLRVLLVSWVSGIPFWWEVAISRENTEWIASNAAVCMNSTRSMKLYLPSYL